MKLYVKLEAPYEWVRVTGNKVEAFGVVPTPSDYPLGEEDELIGVVPSKWVTAHAVNLPAKTKRQFQAAVPYALEEAVSEDVESLHFTCPQWKAGETLNVYVVAKEKMREWQQSANQHKLPLDRIIAEYSLLPFHDAADCSLAIITVPPDNQAEIVANHRQGGGVSIDPDFIDVWLMDVPISSTIAVNDEALTTQLIESHSDRDFRYWSFGNKLAHWLEHEPIHNYDLLADEFRPSVRSFEWRSFMVPIAVVATAVFCVFLYDTYRYFALHAEIRSIQEEQQKIVMNSFPELDFVDPNSARSIMQQAISRLGGKPKSATAQSVLAEAAGVLKSQNVSLSNIVYRDSEMIITCLLNDFSQVDKLMVQLNSRPNIKASLQSSASDDGQIVASYVLTTG